MNLNYRFLVFLLLITVSAALVGYGTWQWIGKPKQADQLTQAPPGSMQVTPGGTTAAGAEVSDQSRLDILMAYTKAIGYSQSQQHRQTVLCDQDADCKRYRDMTQKSVDDYNALIRRVVKDEKLPEGTGFQVNAQTGQVVAVPPQK